MTRRAWRTFVAVNGEAYATYGMPDEVHARTVRPGERGGGRSLVPTSWSPWRAGEAGRDRLVFESDGVASLQWVGTVPHARGTGLGALVTVWTTNLAFDRGRVVVHVAGFAHGRARLPRARLRDDLPLHECTVAGAAPGWPAGTAPDRPAPQPHLWSNPRT